LGARHGRANRYFRARGDLALFLWAAAASTLAGFALRELTAASRRFDDFVHKFGSFNNCRPSEPRGSLKRRSTTPVTEANAHHPKPPPSTLT
jgi:hypothetical protein